MSAKDKKAAVEAERKALFSKESKGKSKGNVAVLEEDEILEEDVPESKEEEAKEDKKAEVMPGWFEEARLQVDRTEDVSLSSIDLTEDTLRKGNRGWADKKTFDLQTSKAALAFLAERMEAEGQMNPVCLEESAKGKLRIVYGHRRCLAAQSLGWKKIRAQIIASAISEEARALLQERENQDASKKRHNWGEIAASMNRMAGGEDNALPDVAMKAAEREFNLESGTLQRYRLAYRLLPASCRYMAHDGILSDAIVVSSLLKGKDEDGKPALKYQGDELKKIVNSALVAEKDGKKFKLNSVTSQTLRNALRKVSGEEASAPITRPSKELCQKLAMTRIMEHMDKLDFNRIEEANKIEDDKLIASAPLQFASGLLASCDENAVPEEHSGKALDKAKAASDNNLRTAIVEATAILLIESNELYLRKGKKEDSEIVPFLDGRLQDAKDSLSARAWVSRKAAMYASREEAPRLKAGKAADTLAARGVYLYILARKNALTPEE